MASTPLEKTITRSRQSRIWVCQKKENPVAGCAETMKHRFSDFNQVVICGVQKAVLRAFPPLEISFYLLYQSRILGHPEGSS
jgi:hypothetical protein